MQINTWKRWKCIICDNECGFIKKKRASERERELVHLRAAFFIRAGISRSRLLATLETSGFSEPGIRVCTDSAFLPRSKVRCVCGGEPFSTLPGHVQSTASPGIHNSTLGHVRDIGILWTRTPVDSMALLHQSIVRYCGERLLRYCFFPIAFNGLLPRFFFHFLILFLQWGWTLRLFL